jgi:hypothetical protein
MSLAHTVTLPDRSINQLRGLESSGGQKLHKVVDASELKLRPCMEEPKGWPITLDSQLYLLLGIWDGGVYVRL